MSDSKFFANLGNIFRPLVTGFVIAGLSSGIALLLEQIFANFQSNLFINVLCLLLRVINDSFTLTLTLWVGLSASKVYSSNMITGGMLGMMTNLETVDHISSLLGLDTGFLNYGFPFLKSGSGGVIAVIFGIIFLSYMEKLLFRLKKGKQESFLIPFLAFLITLPFYLFLIMPVFGILTNLLSSGLNALIFNESLPVRIFFGAFCSAMFLPSCVLGMQHAFVAIYAMQLELSGSISLYPVLAMAGSSQVGSGIAVYLKTKRNGNKRLENVVKLGLFPGVLGLGSPLLYGMTISHLKVLLSSCIGASFGGAYIIMMRVSATGWGTSGLLALPLMTAGVNSPLINMLNYFLGLLISCFFGFVITCFCVSADSLKQ